MSGPALTVGRSVVTEMARMAAYEVPGVVRVGRRGPAWRAWLAGPAVGVRIRDGRVQVRIHVIARPAQSLAAVAAGVRSAVGATVERLLGLELGSITVVVDAVGG
jgi:uncharacterized alkaline shock family protein YloU